MKRRELTAFGMMVKKRLIELNMTQRQLAETVGIGEVYLNVVLHGERSGRKYKQAIIEYLDLYDKNPAD